MNTVEYDIDKTKDVINMKYTNEYDRIYFKSNEFLKQLFSNTDFNNKHVLTVLGSSDQALLAYDLGASSVDVFDKNILAKYYYYIRIWTIKYLGKFYPDFQFDIRFITELLYFVNATSEDEKMAYEYWSRFVNTFTDDQVEKLFHMGKRSLYKVNISDLSRIRSRISNANFTFYHTDISKEGISGGDYDLIITSNISDYIYPNEASFREYRSNLDKNLKNDGVIISSNLRRDNVSAIERRVFEEIFDIEELPKIIWRNQLKSPGYAYTRKRCGK